MAMQGINPASRLELARGVLRQVERRAVPSTSAADADERVLSVADPLVRLLPLGGLRRGTTLALTTERIPALSGEHDAPWRARVGPPAAPRRGSPAETRPGGGVRRGSGRGPVSVPPARPPGGRPAGRSPGHRSWSATGVTTLLWALVAEASGEGAWVGVIGRPELGLLAAAEAGVRLERLALVPDADGDLLTVVSALIDGLDIVVVGGLERSRLRPTDRERLAARARQRGAVVLALGPWPGADVQLICTDARWSGLGTDGSGRLRRREIVVRAEGRGIGPAGRIVRLPLFAPPSAVRGAAPVPVPAQVPVRVAAG